MPLFFQQQLNANTNLAIWKIEETEAFFKVPLQRSITHPHKRLQHLAGRYLLRHLVPQFPLQLIQVADTRKPFLKDELFHFSIAHCGDFAAAIVSSQNRVGIDIELMTGKIERIQHKFVGPAELQAFSGVAGFENATNHLQNLTLIWSCKEALFKWYGLGEMDFKKHMQVVDIGVQGAKLFQISMRLLKEEDRLLGLQARFFNDLCLSYLVT